MLLGTLLTVACTDMLVTLLKDGYVGMMIQQCRSSLISNGYICLECYQTVHFKVFVIEKLS